VTDRPHLCPLNNLTECPGWAGPCMVTFGALDCPEVLAAAAAVRVEGDGGQA
jgi:hypothetical protein